jgi:hypothetical protein
MMKLPPPLWLLPRRLRDRYGDELREMYRDSPAPLADWMNLLWTGLAARLEGTMPQMTKIALLVVASISLVAGGYALAELEEGWRGVPSHWWSTAPFVSFTLSAGAWALVARRGDERVDGVRSPGGG